LSFFRLARIPNNYLLKLALIIFITSFLGAFWNHSSDLIKGGLFPYSKWNPLVPQWLNIYWTTLTIFDLIAVAILIYNIQCGLFAYLLVIASDVTINFTFVISNYGPFQLLNFFQACQFLFLLFVLLTYAPIHRSISRLKKSSFEKVDRNNMNRIDTVY